MIINYTELHKNAKHVQCDSLLLPQNRKFINHISRFQIIFIRQKVEKGA